MDFLQVVTGEQDQYRDVVFQLEDSCAHGSEPISIEVVNGEIKSLDPETVFVQKGGG